MITGPVAIPVALSANGKGIDDDDGEHPLRHLTSHINSLHGIDGIVPCFVP
jgi:hypothetical protein